MRSRSENISMVIVLIIALLAAAWYFRSTVVSIAGAGGTTSVSSTPTAAASSSTSPSASPSAPPSEAASASPSVGVVGPQSVVAFIGDSFAAGTGASTTAKRWTSLLSGTEEWTEVNKARPQTGYVVSGSTGDCTPDTCPNFPTVAPTLSDSGAALVVISGGANDLTKDPAEVGSAVTATVAAVRTALPNAQIVVLDPWWDMRPEDQRLSALTTAIKEAATSGGATWIDVGQPVAGKSANFAADGFSPNDTGHAALAEAVQKGLAQAGIVPS